MIFSLVFHIHFPNINQKSVIVSYLHFNFITVSIIYLTLFTCVQFYSLCYCKMFSCTFRFTLVIYIYILYNTTKCKEKEYAEQAQLGLIYIFDNI